MSAPEMNTVGHCRSFNFLYDSNFSLTAATPLTRSAKSLVNGPEEPINRSEQPSGSARKKQGANIAERGVRMRKMFGWAQI